VSTPITAGTASISNGNATSWLPRKTPPSTANDTTKEPDADLDSVLAELVRATERHLAEPGLIELFVLTSAE
jgi:hypothetical protein